MCICISTGLPGWWWRDEIRVLPGEGEKLSDTLQVVRRTYHGNSKRANKDDLWKNWQMMVQIVGPEGDVLPLTHHGRVTMCFCHAI